MTDIGQVQDRKPQPSIGRFVGTAPAALVGLAIAAWDARTGNISLYVVLGAALALGVLAALRSAGPVTASEGEGAAQGAILLAHLAAVGLCWPSAPGSRARSS